jgi:hypothetical protein
MQILNFKISGLTPPGHIKLKSLVLFYFSINFCFAGTIDPNTSDEEYINYGKKFPFVAKVVGDNNYYASAVILNKNTFLTNAHVMEMVNKIIVENENNIYEFEINSSKINHGYTKKSHKNDIAIGKIKEDFNLNFYPLLNEEKNELGKIVSICGYGATGNFFTGEIRSDRIRRAGKNKINATSKEFLFCSVSNKPSNELEFLICHGDSGGGSFIENKLYGLNCFIDAIDKTYNADYNDRSGFIRISEYIDWIKENLE